MCSFIYLFDDGNGFGRVRVALNSERRAARLLRAARRHYKLLASLAASLSSAVEVVKIVQQLRSGENLLLVAHYSWEFRHC